MKKIVTILCIAIITFMACNNRNTNGYSIKGTISETLNGKNAKLFKVENRKQVTIDTTVIANGELNFTGLIENPDIHYISIEGTKGNLPLVIEKANMKITFNKDSLHTSIIKGSKENNAMKDYQDMVKPLQKKNQELSMAFRTAQKEKNTQAMADIRKQFNETVKASNDLEKEFIKKNDDKIISTIILQRLINSKAINTKDAKVIFDAFPEYLKTSAAGKAINTRLKSAVVTAIGNVAPNFSAPNPDGKQIALNDIKSKVTIIDFWASWCKPCRIENPNVVKLYNQYHDKGLEIIGVSLDKSTQKDRWIKAIKDDNLKWPQISNLQSWNEPIAKQYGVRAIPATFILDEKGVIVAKNLRGKALQNKIAEMLD